MRLALPCQETYCIWCWFHHIFVSSITNAGITYILGTMFAMLASLVVCDTGLCHMLAWILIAFPGNLMMYLKFLSATSFLLQPMNISALLISSMVDGQFKRKFCSIIFSNRCLLGLSSFSCLIPPVCCRRAALLIYPLAPSTEKPKERGGNPLAAT